jgi:Putative zinc-finger
MSLLQNLLRSRLREFDCKHIGPILQQYLDEQAGHQLSQATREKVAAHLMKCVDCGLERETYLEMKKALSRREDPSPDTLARLRRFAETITDHEGDQQADPDA